MEELAELLNVNGIQARPYHAGLDAATRSTNQDLFLMEEVDVIVAEELPKTGLGMAMMDRLNRAAAQRGE